MNGELQAVVRRARPRCSRRLMRREECGHCGTPHRLDALPARRARLRSPRRLDARARGPAREAGEGGMMTQRERVAKQLIAAHTAHLPRNRKHSSSSTPTSRSEKAYLEATIAKRGGAFAGGRPPRDRLSSADPESVRKAIASTSAWWRCSRPGSGSWKAASARGPCAPAVQRA